MSSKQAPAAGSSKNGRRQSAPSTVSQPAAPEFGKFVNPMMMWPMNPTFSQYMLPGPSTSYGVPGTSAGNHMPNQKPWDLSSEDSDEDDFVPAKKRKPAAGKTTKKQTNGKAGNKGPGRPTSAEVAARSTKERFSKVLSKYPLAFAQQDSIAFIERDECSSCHIYKGKVAFKPCGHCLYCYSCTNKLRTESLKLKRPAKCPADNCFDLVEGWVQLFNVSA